MARNVKCWEDTIMDAMASDFTPEIEEKAREHHLCPWWVGYLIASPLRKLGENPDTILEPLVEPGMTTVDVGCAMGFFSLPLARMVGESGRVVCVDVQTRMLATLERRARRKGLDHIIETRLATQEDLGLDDLEGAADLLLAIHVLHETAYPRRFLSRCFETLRPGGKLLVIEPKGHVSEEDFEESRSLAIEVGFSDLEQPDLRKSRGLVLAKPPGLGGRAHSESEGVRGE
jgi:2-polyprenyl-3-methyl-5-hydroxy-6-metoxy-1,4-benzoquinol methylase